MFFLGFTRFSVYSYRDHSFASTRGGFTEQAYRDWLYSTERLKPRLDIFLDESVPQLAQAAAHHEMVHVVGYSPSLPEYAKQRLRDAAKEYPFLYLWETEKPTLPGRPDEEVIRKIVPWKQGQTLLFGAYRLDDDDLLPVDYFDRMAQYMRHAEPGWRISFGRGYTALRSQGRYYFPRENHYPMVSVGLLSVIGIDVNGQLSGDVQTPHHKSDLIGPVLLDSSRPGFFRARHESQDNIIGKKVDNKHFMVSAIHEMRVWKEANIEQIKCLFPRLSENVNSALHREEQVDEILSEPVRLTSEGVPFPITFTVGGILSLDLDLVVGRDQLLVSYHILDNAGEKATPERLMPELKLQNVKHNEQHGFHQVIPAADRSHKKYAALRLPEGSRVDGVKLIYLGRRAVNLHSLRLGPLLEPRAG